MVDFRERLGGVDGDLVQVDSRLGRHGGGSPRYRIAYTRWEPERVQGPTVVYNHGLQSHRGWFAQTASELSERGHPVYAFDRIGSGGSDPGLAQRRGEVVSARGHIRDWRLFLDTVERMLERARLDHPGNDVVLWGNSFGGKVVTAFAWDRAERLEALGVSRVVLTVPGNFQRKTTMPLPFSLGRLLLSSPLARFSVPMVERDHDNGARWFVRPGPWFDAIVADELSLREVTRTFYLETARMDRFNSAQRATRRFPVPLLALMVRGDRMMDNEKMERYLRRHASDQTSWSFYRGGPEEKHFLLFTEDRDEALAEIETFLGKSRD